MRLRGSNAALTDAAEEINSGVIGADEVYGTVHGLGCDWETLMVVNVEGVSLASFTLQGVCGTAWIAVSQVDYTPELTCSYTTLTSHLDHYPTPRKRIYPSHTSCVRLKNPSIAQLTHGHNSAVQRSSATFLTTTLERLLFYWKFQRNRVRLHYSLYSLEVIILISRPIYYPSSQLFPHDALDRYSPNRQTTRTTFPLTTKLLLIIRFAPLILFV
jgi:hypothetical protein